MGDNEYLMEAIGSMSQAISLNSTCLTFEEYLARYDSTDTRYELVNGEPIEMPPESDENLGIAKKLFLALIKHVAAELVVWGTEVEVSGRRATCRIPDLLVHTEESKAALAGTKRATITRDMPSPVLVIEVVSRGQVNRDRDYRYKYTEYAARGIAEYWIVDPEMQCITVCQWVNGLYENQRFAGADPIQSAVVPALVLNSSGHFCLMQSLDKDNLGKPETASLDSTLRRNGGDGFFTRKCLDACNRRSLPLLARTLL